MGAYKAFGKGIKEDIQIQKETKATIKTRRIR
jgi:hypothetical protein